MGIQRMQRTFNNPRSEHRTRCAAQMMEQAVPLHFYHERAHISRLRYNAHRAIPGGQTVARNAHMTPLQGCA